MEAPDRKFALFEGGIEVNLIRSMILAVAFFMTAFALAQSENAGDQTAAPWTFTVFDENEDGFLTPGEFGTGLFEFVAGDIRTLSQEQYESTAQTFGVTDAPEFNTADVNSDGVVTADQEFVPAIATGLFEQWDADSDERLSAQEYASGMMGAFDADASGTLDAQEFEAHAEWFETDATEVAGGGAAQGGFGEEFFLGEASVDEQEDDAGQQ